MSKILKNFKAGKSFSFFVVVMLSLVFMFALGGCGNEAENKEDEVKEETEINEEEADAKEEIYKEGEIKLYFTEDTGASFVKSYEEKDVDRVTPKEAMEMLLEGPEDEELFGMSEDVSLLGLEIEEERAYVDFSQELLDISLGHEAEVVLVASIVYTLTQFDGIEEVQILVEGDTADTISGHVGIDEPLTEEDL